jgi:sugar phosphate isomerase/epimerase
MIRFAPALCSVTFRSMQPAEILQLCTSAGIHAVEWGGDVHVPPDDDARATAVREAGIAAGVAAVSYGSYVAPPQDGLAEFHAGLAMTRALGASNIRIWPGSRGRNSRDYAPAERARIAALIRVMAEEAAAARITVSLEYHPNSLTDDTSSAEALMAEIDHPNVFLYWQPRPGLMLAEALAEIRSIGVHVSHLHVFAWDRARNRFPLEAYADYWRAILDAIPEGRWTGQRFAMLEFVAGDAYEAFLNDSTCLRRLLGG